MHNSIGLAATADDNAIKSYDLQQNYWVQDFIANFYVYQIVCLKDKRPLFLLYSFLFMHS